MKPSQPPEPEGYEFIQGVGQCQQLTDTPRKKKKHPIGFAPPKEKTDD